MGPAAGGAADRVWGWALVPLLASGLLWLKLIGAPLGEPAADDFDFLAARLHGQAGFFTGGGSESFWRPITHQVYYAVMSGVLFRDQWVAPLVHWLALVASAWLLILLLRESIGVPAASMVGAGLLLSEPARSLISWPSHAVEIGFLFFSCLYLWAAVTRRYGLALLAALLGLLSKEAMVVVLPLGLAFPGSSRAGRRRVGFAIALLVLGMCWLAVYGWVGTTHHLHPPSSITSSPGVVASEFLPRFVWGLGGVIQVALGTEHLQPAPRVIFLIAYGLVFLLAMGWNRWTVPQLRDARGRATTLWGLGLFAASIAGLTVTYPIWAPYRGVHASIGLMIAAVVTLAGCGKRWAILAVCLKAFTLTLAAPPLAAVGLSPPESRSVLDFEKLTRLQLLCRDARTVLSASDRRLGPGAVVAQLGFPLGVTYALGGDHALQSWAHDGTMHWIGYGEVLRRPGLRVDQVVTYESGRRPSVAVCSPRIAAGVATADTLLLEGKQAAAMLVLDSLLASRPLELPHSIESACRYRRALVLGRLGRAAEAMEDAGFATADAQVGGDARFLLALLLADAGQREQAVAQLDTLLAGNPNEPRARDLRRDILNAH